MNIEFRKIDRSNYNECIELKISEDQKRFVASNMYSLVQAAYEPNLYPLGIYKEITRWCKLHLNFSFI